MEQPSAPPGENPGDPPSPQPPPLDEAARRIGAAGKELGADLWAALRSFRALLLAELALSRAAMMRVLVLATIGTALGATAWLYLMAVGVLGLRAFGLPWWAAVRHSGAGVAAGRRFVCVWLALKALEDTQFKATRQLSAQASARTPTHWKGPGERTVKYRALKRCRGRQNAGGRASGGCR